MSEARVSISIGTYSLTGEGTEAWLGKLVQTFFEHSDEAASLVPLAANSQQVTSTSDQSPASEAAPTEKAQGTLVSFIQQCDATDNQNRKFLAAAAWLTAKHNRAVLTIKETTDALKSAQQQKIANPTQCLNRLIAQGSAERSGNGFYVTTEGRKFLGLKEQM